MSALIGQEVKEASQDSHCVIILGFGSIHLEALSC